MARHLSVTVGSIPAPPFILGVTQPTWANSGCRTDKALLTVDPTTNFVTSADGQVIEGLYLPYGRIEVRHRNVTIRDCIISTGWDSNRLLIHNNPAIVTNPNYDTRGWSLEHVTIDPVNAGTNGVADDYMAYGVYLQGAGSAYRCAIHNVTDAFAPDNSTLSGDSQVTIQGCYIETRYLPYDPGQSNGTHNDGVQLAQGTGHVMEGNTFVNPTGTAANGVFGQCIVVTPYHGAISNVTVKNNWLSGGYTTISFWPHLSEGGPSCDGAIITGNRIGGACTWPILLTPEVNAAKVDISGNVAGVGGLTWNGGFIAEGGAITPTIANAT